MQSHFMVRATCLILMSFIPGLGGKKSYDGYRVVRIHLHGDGDWLAVVEDILNNDTLQVELWSQPSGPDDDVDIQVAPQHYSKLETLLTEKGFDHSLLIENIQTIIEEEEESERYQLLADDDLSQRVKRSLTTRVSNHVVGKYATYEEIESWIRLLAKHFRHLASVETLGWTHEGNPISVLKLGTRKKGKRAIYLDSGIHAREWISPASVVYIIYHLLIGHYTGVGEGAELLEKLDWYFVPVANPDGYKYSHEEDRLWRKNRSPNVNNTCNGTDLNRNWPYYWGGAMTSTNPCSIVYHGPSPGSELETQALMAFLLRERDNIGAFISHHSYTQKWFTRWGYTNSTPADHGEMMTLAQKAVDAVEEVGGESYEVGRPFELLYAYSGGSADWVKGVAGIKYAYTIELRDRGQFGFVLPANYVIPVGEELWAGVRVVAGQLVNETTTRGSPGGGRGTHRPVTPRRMGGGPGNHPTDVVITPNTDSEEQSVNDASMVLASVWYQATTFLPLWGVLGLLRIFTGG